MPFHRGDVFVKGHHTGIEEYSPDGTPVQVIEGTQPGGGFCFDPSGHYLIVPGVGLFDKQGRMLESNWTSDEPTPYNCVADGLGNVFVTNGQSTITKYEIHGQVLGSFNVHRYGFGLAIALAPDDCTIYYGGWLGEWIGRFNVCTNTQESAFVQDDFVDELRVLPNGEVLSLFDSGAIRFGPSEQRVGVFFLQFQDKLRTMALDSDGTSFWVCCTVPEYWWREVGHLLRFDINSGELLAQWEPIERGAIAVYSPDNNGRGAG
jgi:hypothetical protein